PTLLRRLPPLSLFPSPTLFRSRERVSELLLGRLVLRKLPKPEPRVYEGVVPLGLILRRLLLGKDPLTRHARGSGEGVALRRYRLDRKSTRLNSSHVKISYAVFC